MEAYISLPPAPAVYLLLVSLPLLVLCETNCIYTGHYLLKPLSSLAFLAGPLLLAFNEPSPYRQLVAWGLFFSLIGDVLLIPSHSEYTKHPKDADKVTISASFQAGIGAFAAAHIAYILAFLQDTQTVSWPVFCGTVLLSVLLSKWLGVAYPSKGARGGSLVGSNVLNLTVPDDMRHLVFVYALIISCMVGAAVSTTPVLELPSSLSMQSQRALGALMFVISDIFVAKDAFGKKSADKGGYFWLKTALGWGLYFWGQMVIAGTVIGR